MRRIGNLLPIKDMIERPMMLDFFPEFFYSFACVFFCHRIIRVYHAMISEPQKKLTNVAAIKNGPRGMALFEVTRFVASSATLTTAPETYAMRSARSRRVGEGRSAPMRI